MVTSFASQWPPACGDQRTHVHTSATHTLIPLGLE